MIINIVSDIISKVIKKTLIGPLDWLLGAFIGGVKGVLLLIPILVPMMMLKVNLVEESVLVRPLIPLARYTQKKLTNSDLVKKIEKKKDLPIKK